MGQWMRHEAPWLAALLVVAYWPLFYLLDAQPLHLWDEAFTAVQAVELRGTSNWWVPTFDHSPDHIHTKPPLVTWLAALGMRVLGPTELAVRLPSALAGLATVLLVYGIGAWAFSNRLLGFAAALILLTAPAYTGYHITRNGDTDALLTLWTTLACWCFYRWLLQPNRWQPLVGLGVALVLVVWTKGVQGLMILPGLALYAAVAGRFRHLLGWRFGLTTLATLLAAASYYLIRELYDPGYLALVARSELFSRFTEAFDGHTASSTQYLDQALSHRFVPWAWLVPVMIGGWALRVRSHEHRLHAGWYFWPALTYLALISVAETKVDWYDAPLYPLLAYGVAVWVVEPLARLMGREHQALGMGLVAAFLLVPYARTLDRIQKADQPIEWFAVYYGSYCQRLQVERPEVQRVVVLEHSFNPALYFYREQFRQTGQPLMLAVQRVQPDHRPPDWPVGAAVLTAELHLIPWIETRYRIRLLHEWRSGIPHVHPFQTWLIESELSSE